MERPPRIAVYGSSTVAADEPDYALARDLGRELARAGAAIMSGGYGGVMEAVSRGAAEAGGHAIGVTVELYSSRGAGNRWLAERWNTSDLFDRLRRLVTEADGFVAVTGSLGTVAEVALTWTLLSAGGRPSAPLVLLGRGWSEWLAAHRNAGFVRADQAGQLRLAAGAEEAARLVMAGLEGKAGPALRRAAGGEGEAGS